MTIKADVETIRDMISRRQIEPERWERRFSSADIEFDISQEEINITVEKLKSSSLVKFRDTNNILKILEDLSVAKYGRLTNAGDVIFTKNSSIRYPQLRVKAVCFEADKTDATYSDFKIFEGPLVTTLEETHRFILRNISTKAVFQEKSLERKDEPIYPSNAIREGLVNAFAHRDYSDFSGGISIYIYPKRLEIFNSGCFPEGGSELTMGTGQISVLRNPDIAHVLYLRKLMEKLGRGSAMIKKECEDNGLPTPKWHSDQSGVTLTFFTPEAIPEVAPEVTKVIRSIIGEMSKKDLLEKVGLKDDKNFSSLYLKPAMKLKLIEMTIPDKPTSRNQKYRLTYEGNEIMRKNETN